VLLSGDAAHQTPPFMGQGLCSGIRDAANLAWKLGRVLDGESPDTLLDTYQVERAPHVRHVVETSVGMGRIVCELDPDRAAARDRELLAARAAGKRGLGGSRGGQVAPLVGGVVFSGDPAAGWLFPQPVVAGNGTTGRLDDLAGRGFRLVIDSAALLPPAERLRASGVVGVVLGAPDTPDAAGLVETGAPSALRWLEGRGIHAALVRPDHYVFGGASAPADVASLLDELDASLRAVG
jgi:3-(3-hydroxy-phenyl)propionate hydroxylase